MEADLFGTNDKRINIDKFLHENKGMFDENNMSCEKNLQCNETFALENSDKHLKSNNVEAIVPKNETVCADNENKHDNKCSLSLSSMDIINGENPSLFSTGPDFSLIVCKLCDMKFNGPTPYEHHIKGKTHQKQLRKEQLIQSFSQTQGLITSESISMHSNVAVQSRLPSSDTSLAGNCFLLKPHDTEEPVCTPETKHNGQNTLPHSSVHVSGLENPGLLPSGLDSLPLTSCKLCKMKFNGPTPYEHHIKGKTHQKQLQKEKLMKSFTQIQGLIPPENKADSGSSAQSDTSISSDACVSTQNFHPLQGSKNEMLSSHCIIFHSEYKCLYCIICGKSFSGMENALEHLASKKHQKAVFQNETLKCIKNQSSMNNLEESGIHLKSRVLQPSTQYSCDEHLHSRLKDLEISPKIDQMNIPASDNVITEKHLNCEEKSDQPCQSTSDSEKSCAKSDEMNCNVCGIQFKNVIEVANHFESDEHMEKEFAKMKSENL